jgi:hypothetical protein
VGIKVSADIRIDVGAEVGIKAGADVRIEVGADVRIEVSAEVREVDAEVGIKVVIKIGVGSSGKS